MALRNRSSQVRRAFSVLSLALAGGGLALGAGSFSAQAQTTIVQNFAGLNQTTTAALDGFNLAPPDTDGVAGPGAFVQFTNGGFAAYTPTGGTLTTAISDTAFWNAAGISATLTNQGLSDPRITYDAASGRYFATEITLGTPSGNGYVNNSVLVAVSNTSNVADGFKATSYTAVSATRFGDFPTLGVDGNALMVGTNNFSAAGAFTGITFSSIPKSSLLAAGGPSTTGKAGFTQTNSGLGFAPQGVNNQNSTTANSAVIGISATAYNSVKVTPVVNSGAAGATLGTTKSDTLLYDGDPTFQHQADGSRTLDGGDNRISAAVKQVGNVIYAANAINNGNKTGSQTAAGLDSIHWMAFNATTGALLQEGLISDPANDLTYPSIAANAKGDIVIGFTESGSSLDISSYAAVGHTDASGNITFDAPIQLKLGTVSGYTDGFGGADSRFGDYSATSVDPNDPTKFWTIQEIPTGPTTWGTQITELSVLSAAVPEPGTWAMIGLGSTVLLVGGVKRRQKA